MTDPQRVTELRSLIHTFLAKRLEDKLDKLAIDDPKRIELAQQFVPATWLDDAARRVEQIQAVTHSIKPIHPDAKGSSLYSAPSSQSILDVVGSHCLGDDFEIDVVGNAAALNVYKFLKLEHDGSTLLDLSLRGDAHFKMALHDDPEQAQEWLEAFAGLAKPRDRMHSHTLAKQLFWPVGDDPHDDHGFDLLVPLHASSLAHRIHLQIQDDRFGEAATAAREARKKNEFSDRYVREYPNLAIRKVGGTKPHNISQLNSDRRGENLLLASLPPVWRTSELKPLWNVDSLFVRYGFRTDVKRIITTLQLFLKKNPKPNEKTRLRVAALLSELIDIFQQLSAEFRSLSPGWSQLPACKLPPSEQHWLDPAGVQQARAADGRPVPTDTAEQISAAFGRWLNARLQTALDVGDAEFQEWRKRLHEHIQLEDWEIDHEL
ncbi:type I-F CRISPR-associated protein Csy1 [uncultured Massilia sp.]|uniref:type I-F CRISPR-associated protein Csy1 n=1 Tax=uncultured Massilia sp. TaxID=169973 RepID=UPI0025E56C4D|nr:type I-F CRISPR-associated protein Csy1 [uncultured Massilia sp.]